MKSNKSNKKTVQEPQCSYESMSRAEQKLYMKLIDEIILGNFAVARTDVKDENGENYFSLSFDNL